MIRIDAAWFALEPLDKRAGVDTALARVVSVFGEARVHRAYLFMNKRSNRMKVLVPDGFRLWLCARRLLQGRFIGARTGLGLPGPVLAARDGPALEHRRVELPRGHPGARAVISS